MPPDPDTIAHFRQTFLPKLKDLLVQVLLLAHAAGVLKLGNISLDGTTMHADASQSHAVSDQRLLELARVGKIKEESHMTDLEEKR